MCRNRISMKTCTCIISIIWALLKHITDGVRSSRRPGTFDTETIIILADKIRGIDPKSSHAVSCLTRIKIVAHADYSDDYHELISVK